MTTLLLDGACWLCMLASAEVTLSALARRVLAGTRRFRGRVWQADGPGLTPWLSGTLMFAFAAVLGIPTVLGGTLLALACLTGGAVWLGRPLWLARSLHPDDRAAVRRRLGHALASQPWAAWHYLRDLLLLLRPLRRKNSSEPEPAPVVPAATRPVPDVQQPLQPQRPVPAPRPAAPAPPQAPAAPSVPQPRDIAAGLADAGITAPHDWLALAGRIRSFEAETAEEMLDHIAEEAAGHVAYAEAFKEQADYLLSHGGARLDPGFVQGYHELADEIADLAGSYGQLDARFHAIYETVLQWLAEGRDLPKDGDFLGNGTGGYDPAAGDDDGLAA